MNDGKWQYLRQRFDTTQDEALRRVKKGQFKESESSLGGAGTIDSTVALRANEGHDNDRGKIVLHSHT